ncbi:uncharacterized protein SAPINGB_P004522 [Magnusiomyces paraingens]|uniref:TNase-like domain-containing protein n=1 Tax=Magnusiomyces paraingens TaxID=2606893 RepID=A0A5E8BXE5_9ASCO|nr:uncharacterized protein SAPINGB_P004522 [Saprochaete ingens]VVT55289.1 unnamed protein product [Saprochaete ingens]
MSSQVYSSKVKSVLSGDTVIFENDTQISLAYVSAPRLQTEPYGFQAREYLRTLLVGKPVRYRIHYQANNNTRNYGDISAPVFPSLIEKALTDGNVKLRDDAQSRIPFSEIYDKYLLAETAAKDAELGLWNPESVNDTVEILQIVPEELYGDGAQHVAIIERVIAGDRVQIRVMLNKHSHILTNALVAGIRCPRSSGGPEGSQGEPFGDAAKAFTETRLLQRAVKVSFLAANPSNGLPIAEVIHPVGNIATFLLSTGLASIADWQSSFLGPAKMAPLRAAEKTAKDAHLNMWKDLAQHSTLKSASSSSSKSFEATVAKVVSSDTFVLKLANGKEQTVQLTSVRAPRKSDPNNNSLYVPIAREYARRNYIGKNVKVQVDSIRPESAQFDERALVTLTAPDGSDVATSIIESGYATVTRHRKDDNDRSPNWDNLLAAENKATEAHTGIHSIKPPAPTRTVDASESQTRAKTYLTQLSRQSKISGVVEHISSAGRIRIAVPHNNLVLTLVHAGVRVPKPNEAFGDEALEYISDLFYQRDVQFTVSNVDKTGAFIGNLFLQGSDKPVSVDLVEKGFAEVHDFSAQSSGFKTELDQAQASAQAAHTRMWKNYKGEEEKAKEEAAAVAAAKAAAGQGNKATAAKNYFDIVVTNVAPSGEVSYRLSNKQAAYTKLMADLASYHNGAGNAAASNLTRGPRRGETVTVVPKRGVYARGRVIVFDKTSGIFTINDVDTGKTAKYNQSQLKSLPAQFSTALHPELAKTVVLSFIKLPPSAPTNYLAEYVDALRDMVEGQTVVANVDSPSTVTPASATLFTAKSTGPNDSVNSALIDEGYAFVKSKLTGWETWDAWKPTLKHLRELQRAAQQDRVGVWEYGDPESDEE